MKVEGLENVPEDGSLLMISNHQSFLDPMLCGVYLDRPVSFLARDTLYKGIFGWIIRSVDTIPVKRGEADIGAMKAVIEKLKNGRCVCLFPEGTRTQDGRISAFKPGFGLLCRRGGAAVVPVVIDGAFEAWPRHKKFFTRGAAITVSYGKCITAEQVKDMSNEALADELTVSLRRMQSDCRKRSGKEPFEY